MVTKERVLQLVLDHAQFYHLRRYFHQSITFNHLVLYIIGHVIVRHVPLQKLDMVQRRVQRPFNLEQVATIGLKLILVDHSLEDQDVLPDFVGFVLKHGCYCG